MKEIKLSAPQTWNELSAKQLLYVCRLYLLKFKEHEFKLLVFLFFTGVRALPERTISRQAWFFQFRKQRFSLSLDELNVFLASFSFLLTDSRLTRNHFPSFRIFFNRYYGPEDKIYNVTFLEFLNIEAVLQKYHQSSVITHLRELTAILYRKQVEPYRPDSPDYPGDRREKFNDYTYQKRAKAFRFLDIRKLYAVYIYYIGCRNFLMEKHPNIFENRTPSSEPADVVQNLRNIVFALNGGDITLNTEIWQTKIWEVFGELENRIAENKKLLK